MEREGGHNSLEGLLSTPSLEMKAVKQHGLPRMKAPGARTMWVPSISGIRHKIIRPFWKQMMEMEDREGPEIQSYLRDPNLPACARWLVVLVGWLSCFCRFSRGRVDVGD